MLNSNPSLNDMNKISKWICLLPFLSLLVSLPSQRATGAPPQLGPKLRQKVNLKIGEVEDYQPQTADLTPINRLDLKGLGAADGPATLEGLDRLGNLTELELSDSHLESSTHLRDLRKLKIFKFSRGKINSLKPDANQLRSRINTFTALEECELRGNDLDVSFLNGLDLPQLTDLDLSENQLANVNSIGGGNLSKLKRLNLSQNPLQRQQAGAPVLKALHNANLEALDLSRPVGINNDTANALFFNNEGNGIVKLPKLKNLNLKKTKFKRISQLADVSLDAGQRLLEKLNLSGNDLEDKHFRPDPDSPQSASNPPDALEDLTKLRLLDISDNPISDATPIVRLAQRKLGIDPISNPGLSAAPAAETDPDLIVIATNTQLSAAQLQQLADLGVTIIADVHTFDLHLIKGLNMISLPLNTGNNFTAKSFAQYLVAEPTDGNLDGGNLDGGNLDRDGEAIPKAPSIQSSTKSISLIIRYHYTVSGGTATGGFETYLPDVDTEAGFPVTGGEGYIVNLVSDTPAHTVTFSGTAWKGEHNPLSQPSAGPNSTPLDPWAFVVAGQLPPQLAADGSYSVRLKQGDRLLQELKNVQTDFRLALVDMARQPVVHPGQQLRIEIVDSAEQLVGYSDLTLKTEDLVQAYVRPQIQYNRIPGFSRLLQNYPNPFNPETWIPFELNQQAEVVISIYDVAGRLVRQLDVGHHPAGVYTNQQRAAYWDGKTESGETVASGIYLYTIQINESGQTDNFTSARRMVILK